MSRYLFVTIFVTVFILGCTSSYEDVKANSYNQLDKQIDSDIILNPCEEVSDAEYNAKCNSVWFKDVSHCFSLNNKPYLENCIHDFAKIFSNFEACDLINDSIKRNTCKTQVKLDISYCNILAPGDREECSSGLDIHLCSLAAIGQNSSYIDMMSSLEYKQNCGLSMETDESRSFRTSNISSCETLNYNPEHQSNYQLVYTCYIYHISKSEDSNICETVPEYMEEECNALINKNISFCYDKNEKERDWCLGHFSYYYNDSSYCRESYNKDNCLSIAGTKFFIMDFCLQIEDIDTKDSCINHVSTSCYNSGIDCSYEYCSEIEDNWTKSTCTYYSLENGIKYNN